MDAEQVTRRQARIIHARVAEMRMYLHRLHQRMVKRGFNPGDPLLEFVRNAQQAIGELYVDLEIRKREGPVSVPESKHTPWLEQKSARKRHDQR
jgi:hypothetical protein